MLDDEIRDILEKLDVNLTTWFWKRKRIKIISKRKSKWNRKIKRRSSE